LDREIKEKDKQLKKQPAQEKKPVSTWTISLLAVGYTMCPLVIEFIDALDRKQLSALADEVKLKTVDCRAFYQHGWKSAVVVSIAEPLPAR